MSTVTTTITTTTNMITTDAATPAQLAAQHLRSPAHGWSVGIPGAIGEFMYDRDEAVTFSQDGGALSAVTARGGIRITLPAQTTCVALEGIAECTGGWTQSIAFCVAGEVGRCEITSVFTEHGHDHSALTPAGREEFLFDLGLGSNQVQFCVRTGDAALLEVLRTGVGKSIFAADNPAFAALREASPARVIRSKYARVEVYQHIAEKGHATPLGPHTHLLPAFLNGKRSVAEPALPAGTIAPLTLYPEHPLFDKYGTPTPFKQAAHDEFQQLLARHGSADYLMAKARFRAMLGESDEIAPPERPQPEWMAYTVMLSQLQALRGEGLPGRGKSDAAAHSTPAGSATLAQAGVQ